MDNKKDTKKTEKLSEFVIKETLHTNPFSDNLTGLRAYKKAERIVAAIYLVTNHIDSNEPVRSMIRQEGNQLLFSIISSADEMRTVDSAAMREIRGLIRHLISLVRILGVSGYLSFDNADIVTDALDDIGSLLESAKRSVLSESIRLSRDELVEGYALSNRISLKDIKDNQNSKALQLDESVSDLSTPRKEALVQVLSGREGQSIKDIAMQLPEFSEKMIQRELAELVRENKVLKIGAKRWSKYRLANAVSESPGPANVSIKE